MKPQVLYADNGKTRALESTFKAQLQKFVSRRLEQENMGAALFDDDELERLWAGFMKNFEFQLACVISLYKISGSVTEAFEAGVFDQEWTEAAGAAMQAAAHRSH